MKTEVLIVPNDTVLVDVQSCELGHADPQLSAGFPPTLFADVLKSAYVSAHCAEGWATYERGCSNCSKHGDCDAEAVAGPHDAPTSDAKLRVVAELLANGVGGRLEPLFPAPDDLFVDPGPRDAVWAQPAYLEALTAEHLHHNLDGLRLLVPSSRNPKASAFHAYLTRKGVRVWAERKPQRLSEGEHYLPARRLFDIEVRHEPGTGSGRSRCVTHVRLKPGIGFLVTVELPDDRPGFSLPVTVPLGPGSRTARLEAAQFPHPAIDLKPRKRWRLCVLSATNPTAGGWPPWMDDEKRATRSPLPPDGKVLAVAQRAHVVVPNGVAARRTSSPTHPYIPVGTTYFIEFSEPVRIEQSADILVGGS